MSTDLSAEGQQALMKQCLQGSIVVSEPDPSGGLVPRLGSMSTDEHGYGYIVDIRLQYCTLSSIFPYKVNNRRTIGTIIWSLL